MTQDDTHTPLCRFRNRQFSFSYYLTHTLRVVSSNGPMSVQSEGQKKSAPLPTLRGPLFSLSLYVVLLSNAPPSLSNSKNSSNQKEKKKTKSHSCWLSQDTRKHKIENISKKEGDQRIRKQRNKNRFKWYEREARNQKKKDNLNEKSADCQ